MKFILTGKFKVKKPNEFIFINSGSGHGVEDFGRWHVLYERKDGIIAQADYLVVNKNGLRRGDWLETKRTEYESIEDALSEIESLPDWYDFSKSYFHLRENISDWLEEERQREDAQRIIDGDDIDDEELPF